MTMNLPRDNKSSCEREVTLAPGQSLPRGSSLSRVHVNRPLEKTHKSIFSQETYVGRLGGLSCDISLTPKNIDFSQLIICWLELDMSSLDVTESKIGPS